MWMDGSALRDDDEWEQRFLSLSHVERPFTGVSSSAFSRAPQDSELRDLSDFALSAVAIVFIILLTD